MCKKNELSRIIESIAMNARDVFGERLKDIVLFGSYARGDYNENSDIDIMIIADIEDNQVMQYIRKMSDFLSDLSLEYDIMISPVIEPLGKYELYKDTIPFLQKVQKEGIRVAS